MKRFLSLVILLSGLNSVWGQFSISLMQPPGSVIQKEQLWNMAIVYSSDNPTSIRIGMRLLELKSNQVMMTATTRPISIVKGVKQIKAIDINPVDYNILSPGFDAVRFPNAFIPVGNYRVCYTVSSATAQSELALAEECIELEVAPLSPPQLIMPQDSSEVENAYPQFSWLPPSPPMLFTDLNYDLILTEVRPGQAAQEAIQENIPLYNASRLRTNVHNYASSFKSLDTGRVYAWRVVAKNGENFAAQTDVWTFKLANKKTPLIPANGTYLELRTDHSNANTGIIPDRVLGIKYYSYDADRSTDIIITDENGVVQKKITRNVKYGNNFFVLQLDQSFKEDTSYWIEIVDKNSVHFKASFRISN